MVIDTCVDNFSGAVLKDLAESIPKCRSCDDPRPLIPGGIQVTPEDPAAEAVASHQGTRSESRVKLPVDVCVKPAQLIEE